MAVGETTKLRASAAGIASRELTLTTRSKVRVEVARRRDGSAVVTGTTDPRLPGRVLWLRSNAGRCCGCVRLTPSARTGASDGRFRLTLRRPRRGRCQAVFIPSGARAERATSNRFAFLAGAPVQPGELRFKALQTYADATVVRWIGAPDSDNPAAVVNVAAGAPKQNAGGESGERTAPAATATSAPPVAAVTGDSDALAIVLGAAGLVLGTLALIVALRGRRRVRG